MGQDAFFRRAKRPAAIGAAAVSCFAVLFLTMLCTLFYNIWLDDLRRLTAAEGDWQLRITGQFSEVQLTELRGFAHVARASLCPAAGGSDADAAPTTALELVFSPASAAPDEGPLITAALGLDHDAALAQNTLQYHEELLALLLVRAPGDTAPRLLLPFYLAVLGIACLSLVLILQSSFAVEMRDKLRELGVLASIGATPGQLLRRLVGQALALTALPCLAGLAAEGEVFGVPAELVILDDAAFMDYCAAQGLPRRLDGAVACDRVWDSLHSSFRHPAYLPFLQPGLARLTLAGAEGAENAAQAAALPLLGYADTPPLLREEYDRHSMALFLPETLWRQLQGGGEGAGLGVQPEDGPRIRLLAAEGAGAAELASLRQALAALLAEAGIPAETEDRIAERETNDEMIDGFRLVLGLACGYLALIGLVGIFAHALDFVRLRRREIARYASLGMTPAQLRRMFAREALTLAGRPVLAALVLGAAALTGMIRASELDPAEFWAEAPVLPLGCFVLAVFALVGLAYYLGGRALLRTDLAETLRDETRE